MATSGIIELADDENAALVALLKRTVDADRFLLSPRVPCGAFRCSQD
jgi:hypothetical protein